MPCQSDYMEPTEREQESRRVAEFLCYLADMEVVFITSEVRKAAKSIYGNDDDLDRNTSLLCTCIRGMDEGELDRVVYNGRDKTARRLADWWEDHQERDRKRQENIEAVKKIQRLHASALAKLTREEAEAVGLKWPGDERDE